MGISFVPLPDDNRPLIIEPLDYSNPYDISMPHRHDYFEIVLVEKGNGRQFIDFSSYDMAAGQLYAIYPGQVHLMQRESAQGWLIQFRKDVFSHIQPLRHYHLYFKEQVFNLDEVTFSHLYDMTLRMHTLLNGQEISSFSVQKIYSYLHIVLISLPELHAEKATAIQASSVLEFLTLVQQNIISLKKVTDYCKLMGCGTEKLTESCKTHLGKTPLKLIHEELLLEIQRLMLLNKLSLKEIAFELNFDSQANFSAFIKSHTGLTPSGLQAETLQIYN